MHTISFSILRNWTYDIAVSCQVASKRPKCSDLILFDVHTENFVSDSVYIGDESVFTKLIQNGTPVPENGIIAILSDCRGNAILDSDQISVIRTELPLIPLFNHVNAKKREFDEWVNTLNQIANSTGDLQQLINEGAKLIKTNMMLSGADYKPRAFHAEDGIHDHITDEVKLLGYQTYENILKYGSTSTKPDVKRTTDGFEYIEYISAQNNYRRIFLLRQSSDYTARMGFIFGCSEPDEYTLELAKILCGFISLAIGHESIRYQIQSAPFGCFMTDLLEGRLTDVHDITVLGEHIGLKQNQEYQLIVIEFPHRQKISMVPLNMLLPQISDVFYKAKMTLFEEYILILNPMDPAKKTDIKKLSVILNQYGGISCIGKFLTDLSAIPVFYAQAKDILEIGVTMHPDQSIYYTDDYLEYNFIETVLKSSIMKFNAEKMMNMMCRDEIRRLKLHDKITSDKLFETLYTYLRTFGNASETARLLFLHRNSLNKRLNKIETITGCNLSDAELCMSYLFSCKLASYTDRIDSPKAISARIES